MDRTFDQIPETEDAVHLLIIGDTKTGKSTLTAQAAIDGFYVIYIDGDNGASALRHALRNHPEAKKRIQYFPVEHMATFIQALIRSGGKHGRFNWVKRLERQWGPGVSEVLDDDEIWSFDLRMLPKSAILAIDSWSVVAADALDIGTADAAAKLIDGTDQGIYGEASINLTYIVNVIQKLPCHVIVQAHATTYEKYEKPLNVLGSQMKQKDMKLRETKDVPVSSSRGHGETMVSRFNHIGWLYVSGVGETEIDFTRSANRVGGGPPNKRARLADLPFSKLVSPGIVHVEPGEDWFYRTTHAELKVKLGVRSMNLAPPPKVASPVQPQVTLPPSGTIITAPGQFSIGTTPASANLPAQINLSGAITKK